MKPALRFAGGLVFENHFVFLFMPNKKGTKEVGRGGADRKGFRDCDTRQPVGSRL